MNKEIDFDDPRVLCCWGSFIVGLNTALCINAFTQGWGWMSFVPILGFVLGAIQCAYSFSKMFSEEEENEDKKDTEEEIMQNKVINKLFILMRGLPGSGKSFLANELAGHQGQVFSTDEFFCQNEDGEYRWDGSQLKEAHLWNQKRSYQAIFEDVPVIIIDNTNTTIKEMKSYLPHIAIAQRKGYDIRIEEPTTDWAWDVDELVKRNSHGVPKEAIQRMLDRYQRDVTIADVIA